MDLIWPQYVVQGSFMVSTNKRGHILDNLIDVKKYPYLKNKRKNS